ncbi:hypothetical protein [Spirosoma litoris]
MCRFKINVATHKPVTKLEAHLIEVAAAWCKGSGTFLCKKEVVPIRTLEHFQHALQRERDLYCADNTGARPTSVAIQYLEDGPDSLIWIRPADQDAAPSATISLTAEGIDHKEIQDTLLVHFRP